MKKLILFLLVGLTAGRGFAADDDIQQKVIDALASRIGVTPQGSKLAAKRLVEIGKPAVGALLKLVEDPRSLARIWAVYALCEIRDPRSREAILKSIADKNATVRSVASYHGTKLGDAETCKAVTARFDVERNAGVLAWAIRGLGEGKYLDAAPVIQPLIKHTNPLVRVHTAGALAALRPKGHAPVLSERLLIEKDPQVRQELARLIGLSGDGRVEVIDVLVASLEDADPLVQIQVVGALRKLTTWTVGFSPRNPPRQKRLAIAKWRQWWKINRPGWKGRSGPKLPEKKK